MIHFFVFSFPRFLLDIYLEKTEQSVEISSNWTKSGKIELQMIHFFRFFVFSWTYIWKNWKICWNLFKLHKIWRIRVGQMIHVFRLFVFSSFPGHIWKNWTICWKYLQIESYLAKSSSKWSLFSFFCFLLDIYLEKTERSARNLFELSQIWWNRAPDDPLFSFFCFFLEIDLEKTEKSVQISSNWTTFGKIELQMIHIFRFFRFFDFSWIYIWKKTEQSAGNLFKWSQIWRIELHKIHFFRFFIFFMKSLGRDWKIQ